MKVLTTTAFIIAVFAAILFASSCSKSSTAPSFPGTYVGIIGISGNGNADTIVITTGSTSSSVIMQSRTSAGSLYTIDATVNGSSLTIPTQGYSYNGATDSASGSGTLNGSTLNISYRFWNASGVNNYTYSGTRQ